MSYINEDPIDTDTFTANVEPCDIDDIDHKIFDYSNITNLVNKDYTLCSPLIPDKSDGFINLVKNHEEPLPIVNRDWWAQTAPIYRQLWGKNDISQVKEHHKIWSLLNLGTLNDISEIKELLKRTNKDVKETSEILHSFLRGWIQKDTTDPVKINLNPKTLHFGQLFFLAHKITLVLNIKTDLEEENLRKWIKFNTSDSEIITQKIRYWSDPNFGRIIVGGGFFGIPSLKLLGDRELLLMMKDTWLARFNSLLALVGREDEKFPETLVEDLLRVYEIGDIMLSVLGNEGYKGVKLLEPLCLERLSELAHEYRPLIPDFPRFREHLNLSIIESGPCALFLNQWRNLFKFSDNTQEIVTYYGSFRHWGHPYLDYFDGLSKLHEQVTAHKFIDKDYANALASDLAKMVLHKEFKEKKVWQVNKSLVKNDHPLYDHIMNGTWPTAGDVKNLGDKWHELPLVKCFEIPDVVDPTIIYSDKSHSMKRSEVLDHIMTKSDRPIPGKKVLSTFLDTPDTNWPEFLNKVDKEGLDKDDLVIGLKGKEREMKIAGRYFALMSWPLREYFVMTEHLIKLHYVPLFKGLTMADDLTEVTKKMLDSTNGQGLNDYESVCVSNHFDYEKWNNHQRYDATSPVFTVMGQFLGYPNLIARTHEFFEKSLIYYGERPDLMEVINGNVHSRGENIVAWEGQAGGLEGLRQKGWSILNLLVIQRESKIRNTKVKTLAQGDNQVVCTQYKLPKLENQEELKKTLENLVHNNEVIVNSIIEGAGRIGLRINDDETIQSADLLVYGKIPIFRGNILGLDIKRYSRISCVTNDQIPTLASTMSSVTTNLLTISHHSSSPIEPMRQHLFFGNLVRNLIEIHNPVLQGGVFETIKFPTNGSKKLFKMSTLYLDPSLGGVCGTSLTRFLIRMFPDPITEGLSFWKIVIENTNDQKVKELGLKAGNPNLALFANEHFEKLLESPSSLNIGKNISVTFLLKNEIKKTLQANPDQITNNMVRECIQFSNQEEEPMKNFLYSIDPLFPRFLSEFKSATFLGIVEGITGLFQNSRTIRNQFKNKMSDHVNQVLIESEISSIKLLTDIASKKSPFSIPWLCSSEHADYLRELSWGRKVLGATVPHPIEMIESGQIKNPDCKTCLEPESNSNYLTTSVPKGLVDYYDSRGPLPVYLGSKTMESTSLLQPWEKETKIPLLKRASKLRHVIHWFVEPESNLATSILSIIENLTGEDWSNSMTGFKRTGSSLHRFASSRQSCGGYCAVSPVKLSRINTTTDTLSDLGSENYDFMYQALILYSQITVGELHDGISESGIYHSHIKCNKCLRKIEEPILESKFVYKHPDLTHIINKWIPEGTIRVEKKILVDVKGKDWNEVKEAEGSYHVGRSIGFVFGDLRYTNEHDFDLNNLFPLALNGKLLPKLFMEGLLDGLMRSASISVLHRRGSNERDGLQRLLQGSVLHLINELSKIPAALNLFRHENFMSLFQNTPHKIPPSYPLNKMDLGQLLRSHLECLFMSPSCNMGLYYQSKYSRIWIFSDLYVSKLSNLLVLSNESLSITCGLIKLQNQSGKSLLFKTKKTIEALRSEDHSWKIKLNKRNVFLSEFEIRAAVKNYKINLNKIPDIPVWIEHKDGEINSVTVNFLKLNEKHFQDLPSPPKENCPLISGIRFVQAATGSHYKIRSILSNKKIKYRDFLCGGDGSGGITSLLLRWNLQSNGIFNSLMDLSTVELRGSKPELPSALLSSRGLVERCVNAKTCWENPSDLSESQTWDYFKKISLKNNLKIDLVVLDMEVKTKSITRKIETNIENNLTHILKKGGSLLYKTYLTYLAEEMNQNILTKMGGFFTKVELIQTSYSSFQTSEVYVLFSNLKEEWSIRNLPDWDQIWRDTNQFYCWRSKELELGRSISLKSSSVHINCPKEILPDLKCETTRILEYLGLPGGLSADISHNLSTSLVKDIPNYFCSILILIANAKIPTSIKFQNFPIPLSDNDSELLGGVFTSILFWLSWITEDPKFLRRGQEIFSNQFPCFIEMREFTLTKKEKITKWKYLKWNVEGKGINKSSRLGRKSALIGRFIRCLGRWCRNFKEEWINLDHIISGVKLHNQGISMKLIEKNTPIFKILFEDLNIKEFVPRFYVEVDELPNQGWRD